MKITPLHEVHHKLGATFGERHDGWNIPVCYSDPITEHHAVRKGIGIADISFQGILSLTGEDRAVFLHRLISNDVENLSAGEGNYATLLTNRGKIIADMKVHIFEGTIYLSTAPECVEQAFTELDKYIIADDVELSIATDRIGVIALYGQTSPELVESVFGLNGLSELAEHHSLSCEIDSQWIGCIRSNYVGENGYHLYTTTDKLEWLWNKLTTATPDIVPIGWDALESLRIEAGTPRYGAELSDAIFPLEAELEHAIDFEKGCYIGQEIVARMKYRGHPNRLLRGIEIHAENSVPQNSPLVDGEKKIGWITSSSYSPTLEKQIALGYVRMEYIENSTPIQIQTQMEKVKGAVVDLPFISNIT